MYNVLTLSEPVTDFVATTSPAAIHLQCGLPEDAQRKKVWAVCKAGGIPAHPYDGTRVEMDVLPGFPLADLIIGNELLLPFDTTGRLFIIVHKSNDRVVVRQKNTFGSSPIKITGLWGNSLVRTNLNGSEYFDKFPVGIQKQILLTEVPTYSYSAGKAVITQDHIFLASTTEMGLGQISGGGIEGYPFEYFSSASARIGKDFDTQAAVSYRTRTLVNKSDDSTWCLVSTDGKSFVTMVSNSDLTALPFLALSPDLLLDFTPNPDGSFNPIL